MNLRDELDALAEDICKKVKQDNAGLDQSVDALKALTTYYAVREKVRLKSGDADDDAAGNFDTFSGAIHAATSSGVPNGTAAQPPASRRRNS